MSSRRRTAMGTPRSGARRLPRRRGSGFLAAAVLAIGLAASVRAAEPRAFPVAFQHPASGAPITELGGGGSARSDFLEIDPAQAYEFQGYFKTRDPDRKARIWISLLYLDRNRDLIKPWSVWPLCGTETPLAQPIPRGAQPKDNLPAGWSLRPPYLYAMAFHAQPDLSDLPNLEAVLVDRAVERDYPAGTLVRLHRYTDLPGCGGVATPVWTRYVLQVAGQAPPTEPAQRAGGIPKFWHGAKYLQIEIRNRDPSGGALLFDDLKILQE